nr:MAG TPA: hypothetical protein [Bacteriophage sp.]
MSYLNISNLWIRLNSLQELYLVLQNNVKVQLVHLNLLVT